MESTLVSQNSLFWNKLGKWQALMVILTLATFFITLYFMGDKERATSATFIAVATTALIFAIFAVFSSAAIFVFAVFAAFSSACYAIATAMAFFSFTPVFAVSVIGTLSVLVIITTSDEAKKKYGIRKRFVWLSLTAEFVIILLPMLLA